MKYARGAASLSGLPSLLVVLGGWNKLNLGLCEKYSIVRDKWEEMAAQHPEDLLGKCSAVVKTGILLLRVPKKERGNKLNERIQLDWETEWRLVPLFYQIAKTSYLPAVSFEGRILLFGGIEPTCLSTYVFSEEGELEKDLTSDPLIPSGMG